MTVFFNSLELMPPTPDDKSFSLSIITVMPCSGDSMGDITDCTGNGGIGNGASGSVVNTDENARHSLVQGSLYRCGRR